MTPDQALGLLEQLPLVSDIKHYIVAQEPHLDGSLHLHCYLNYHKKVQWGPHRWDLNDGQTVYHGNYQKANSWRAVARYVTKGANYISNFDVEAAGLKKNSGRLLNKRILESDLTDLVDDDVIPICQLKKLHENKELYFRLKAPVLPACLGQVPNRLGLILPLYEAKQRHYWFWSTGPNTGKTTFLMELADKHPCYWYNYLEIYQPVHKGTQFILMDEYTSPHLKLTVLNAICDGTHQYPVKNSSPVQIRGAVVLVCSNKPPEEVYTSPASWDLIKARFRVFELKPR